MYIERISILNQDPMLASKKIERVVRFLRWTLRCSYLFCIVLMVLMTDGECHADKNKYGCKPSFEFASVYIALGMIIVDALLYSLFFRKCWTLMRLFQKSAELADDLAHDKDLVGIIQSFGIQFLLTVTAMLSCMIDAFINIAIPNYSTLVVFCVDAAIVASCNISMIKESQVFLWKYVCFPCNLCFKAFQQTSSQQKPATTMVTTLTTTKTTGTSSQERDGRVQDLDDTPRDGSLARTGRHDDNRSKFPEEAMPAEGCTR
eukprot:CAMPEP_0202713130 /NCGR_PEP_ID=MMETSP1385-20130828/50153_1 /ASSEMBLY_ACC=CAM_ASM_000861 /TAXON_ID=933848 /ORGANISM="Elphidium margaritaceum" /LENGTH=260 /DNA_ID=CAMNT_0049373383 /DNA_START=320 /DNA_END=1102 /DNA_ORIENTATION=-